VTEDETSETPTGDVDDDTETMVRDGTDTSDPATEFPVADDATAPGTGESDDPSPFDELASEVGADSGDADFDRLFEEMFTEAGTEEMDADSVWEELEDTDGESARTGSDDTDTDSVWGALEETATEDRDLDGEDSVVPTQSFCAQCEHVADPPEVRCTYEGSEIVEFVDEDHVRVRNCPIVARREGISEMERDATGSHNR
jgi:hypothetical protein